MWVGISEPSCTISIHLGNGSLLLYKTLLLYNQKHPCHDRILTNFQWNLFHGNPKTLQNPRNFCPSKKGALWYINQWSSVLLFDVCLHTIDTIKNVITPTEETTFTIPATNDVHSVDVSTNITFGNYFNELQEM